MLLVLVYWLMIYCQSLACLPFFLYVWWQLCAASSGIGDGDLAKLSQILEAVPDINYICIDVANGYSEHFVQFVRDVRKKYPNHTIMVSVIWTSRFVLFGCCAQALGHERVLGSGWLSDREKWVIKRSRERVIVVYTGVWIMVFDRWDMNIWRGGGCKWVFKCEYFC